MTAEWCVGLVTMAATATAAATGMSTAKTRRRVNRLCRSGGAAAAISRTRSRSSNGTSGWAARISATTSRCDMECLLELLESAVQASCAIGGGDPEHPRRGRGVEIEHDAERDNLALAGGESEQC